VNLLLLVENSLLLRVHDGGYVLVVVIQKQLCFNAYWAKARIAVDDRGCGKSRVRVGAGYRRDF
jgi:hypothetical protein